MAKGLDDQVQAFFLRLIEQATPYLFVDASHYKVRDGTRYVKAALVIAGVRKKGSLEILGARVTGCESEVFWSGLFKGLKERGLTGVKLGVSDEHAGTQKAAEAAFLGASWQMCQVHATWEVLKNIPQNTRGYQKAANIIEWFLPRLPDFPVS